MVVDESPSIDDTEWEQEQTFVKDTATAFAARKLFDNGGTASYVSFTGSANHFFTETSEKSFNDAVDAVIRSRTFYTNIRVSFTMSNCMELIPASTKRHD